MIPQIKITDFNSICRFCIQKGEFSNIFERPDLIDLYINITNLTIKDIDCFPKNICHECLKKLENIKIFIKDSKHSHDCLTAVLLDIKDEAIKSVQNAENIYGDTYDDNNILDSEDTEITVKDIHVEEKPQFASNNLFKTHITDQDLNSQRKKSEQGVKLWRCFECGKEFTKKNDLRRHLRIHTGSRPFICTVCDLKFTQKSTLKRHISAIHIIDQKEKYHFECYICEKKFNRKDHLESHIIRCHIKKINERSLENPDWKVCRNCGKSFSLFTYLKHHHETVHTLREGSEPKLKKPKSKLVCSSSNLCSVCGKSFEKRATYLQHMRRSHGPPLPKKTQKEKAGTKQYDNQQQRFQCWQCGKIKSSLCNLKVHMRIHTGEKPYECKFCFRQFSAWNSWHDHENIHLDLKPYQCEHCKKVFRQRSSLRKHLRSSIHIHQDKNTVELK